METVPGGGSNQIFVCKTFPFAELLMGLNLPHEVSKDKDQDKTIILEFVMN
jgi:hypothetical protein